MNPLGVEGSRSQIWFAGLIWLVAFPEHEFPLQPLHSALCATHKSYVSNVVAQASACQRDITDACALTAL